MNRLLADTLQAQLGRPLTEVPRTEEPARPPVEVTVTECHDLVDLWCQLLSDVYVHYNQKQALYGYDPIRALLALKRQIPFQDSATFLRQLTLLINRLRDQHTQLHLPGPPDRKPWVATLPFLVEVFGEYRSPTYLVTKVSDLVDDKDFHAGVHVDTWNGVPFWRALDLYADTLTGGRPDARRARALETITQRPLASLPPPDELWVDIGYHDPADLDPTPRSIQFRWQAVDPTPIVAQDSPIELRTRRAIDATSEASRRTRKLLFQPALWEQEASVRRVARAGEWLPTAFPDAISARPVPTSHGTFGYLRIWTFDVEHSDRFLEEVDSVLRALPRKGLIIDLRSNPGGVIEVAERLLQLFTKTVEPVRFALRVTPATAALTEADGNGADLADWAGSVRTAIDLGEEYSQHLPISDPDRCRGHKLAYHGPVVAVVNPTTFSAGDIFTAGLADHNIATIVSIGEATGAGGANVWTKDDVEYAYFAAGLTLPHCPAGVSYSISMRRAVRASASAGMAIEDIGVSGAEQYTMTENDILNSNQDLIEFCGQILAESS